MAPGNTGPYVFRNGLASALRLRYDRPDLRVARHCAGAYAEVWLDGGGVTVSLTGP